MRVCSGPHWAIAFLGGKPTRLFGELEEVGRARHDKGHTSHCGSPPVTTCSPTPLLAWGCLDADWGTHLVKMLHPAPEYACAYACACECTM